MGRRRRIARGPRTLRDWRKNWTFEQFSGIGDGMGLPYPLAANRYEGFRDEVWSMAVPVVSAGRPSFAGDEREVQARWFGGEYGRLFTGTEGERIEVVQFGHWNRGAGPDFTEAAILVEGRLLRGSVEVDLDVRSWDGHGHGINPAFNDTVLHVFADQPALSRVFTRTEAHTNVAQLLLPQHTGLQGPPDFLPEAFPGRCLAPLARMDLAETESLLVAAAQFRLKRKAERLRVMSGSTGEEQALFQAMAEALGFRWNKTAMAILAQRCPIRDLLGMERAEREARLFGAAGFLDPGLAEARQTPESRGYQRQLWDRWWRMRDAVETIPRRSIRWRTDGIRPLNHPQRRVGALAGLLERWESLRTISSGPPRGLEQHVNNWSKSLSHPFWNHHFTLRSEATPRALRLIGRDRIRDILGNVVFPSAIRVSPENWEEYERLGAVDSNQKLRRAALRLFGPDRERQKLFTRYYHQQQGLLQVFEDFCLEDASGCRDCPFPEQLLQWRGLAGFPETAAAPAAPDGTVGDLLNLSRLGIRNPVPNRGR